MFLRCESYNISRAAIRMISYFDFKLRLFGSSLLTRDVKISDFDKDTQICLESGYFQILPQRDRSGRAICLSCLGLSTDTMTPIQKVSVFFFENGRGESQYARKPNHHMMSSVPFPRTYRSGGGFKKKQSVPQLTPCARIQLNP